MHIAPCHKHGLEHFSLPHACEMMFFTLFFTLQQRNEMIAHLTDQLQEMKAKTSMEGKYIKKDAEVLLLLGVSTHKQNAPVELGMRYQNNFMKEQQP